MNTASVKAGDIVEVDKKGRRFHAIVSTVLTIRSKREFGIKPIERGITYRQATAREVVGHWRKARRRAKSTEGDDS